MPRDPIVEEIRAFREAHAKQFNYDLPAIFADIQAFQKSSGLSYVSHEPKRVKPMGKPNSKRPRK